MEDTNYNSAAVQELLSVMESKTTTYQQIMDEINNITNNKLSTAWSGTEYDTYKDKSDQMIKTLQDAYETLKQELRKLEIKAEAFETAKQHSNNY